MGKAASGRALWGSQWCEAAARDEAGASLSVGACGTSGLALSADGRVLCVATTAGVVFSLPPRALEGAPLGLPGRLRIQVGAPSRSYYGSCAVSADGRTVVGSGLHGFACVWSARQCRWDAEGTRAGSGKEVYR